MQFMFFSSLLRDWISFFSFSFNSIKKSIVVHRIDFTERVHILIDSAFFSSNSTQQVPIDLITIQQRMERAHTHTHTYCL